MKEINMIMLLLLLGSCQYNREAYKQHLMEHPEDAAKYFPKMYTNHVSRPCYDYPLCDSSSEISISGQKSIIGEDDRIEYYQADSIEQYHARRVLAIIPKNKVDTTGQECKIKTNINWWAVNEICSCAKFHNQGLAAHMNAIPIGHNQALTVNHGLKPTDNRGKYYYDKVYLIFGFYQEQQTPKGNVSYTIKKENVYQIKSPPVKLQGASLFKLELEGIVGQSIPEDKIYRRNDFLTDITQVDNIYNIGTSMGLPIKITTKGKAREIGRPDVFSVVTDIFNHSSGSPVFDKRTHKLIGLIKNDGCSYNFRVIPKTCKMYCQGFCTADVEPVKLDAVVRTLRK